MPRFIGSVFLLLVTISFVLSTSDLDNTDSSGTLDENYVYDYYDSESKNKENDKDKAAGVNVQSQIANSLESTTVVVSTAASKVKLDEYYDYEDDTYDEDKGDKGTHEDNNDNEQEEEGHVFIDTNPSEKHTNNKQPEPLESEASTQKTTTQKSARSKLLAIMAKPGILAGIVGGAIIGVLTAILLIMFIVYRMKKKDEGSYALEETKKPLNAYDYRHCPTKEFYA